MMKFNLSRSHFSFLLIMALLFSFPVFAQTGTTSVRGTVIDKSGGAVVGAVVKLENKELGVERSTITDDTGAYEFLSLKPGAYELSVEAAGFHKYDQSNVQLLVNTPSTVNVTLQVGSTNETVEVSAQSVTLNTTDASLGVAFGENQVKELPLESRNVGDLLSPAGRRSLYGKQSEYRYEHGYQERCRERCTKRPEQRDAGRNSRKPKGRIRVSVGAASDARLG